MALSGRRPAADRTRNGADAARRSEVIADPQTKDQRSLRRSGLCRDVMTVAMTTAGLALFVSLVQ